MLISSRFYITIVFACVCVGLSSCHFIRYPKDNCTELEDAIKTVIDYKFSRKNRYYSAGEGIVLFKYALIDREFTGYMHILDEYINGGEGHRLIPLPQGIEIDYDNLVSSLKDTVLIPSLDSIGDLPVHMVSDRSRKKNTLAFSPLISTSDKDYFVIVVQQWRIQDPMWYIFILKEATSVFEVIDCVWDDGPVLYFPLEDDLLEQDYQRMYGG